MRILFDQGTPVPLRRSLTGHHVETAYERGWSRLKIRGYVSGQISFEAEGFDINVIAAMRGVVAPRIGAWLDARGKHDTFIGRPLDFRNSQLLSADDPGLGSNLYAELLDDDWLNRGHCRCRSASP